MASTKEMKNKKKNKKKKKFYVRIYHGHHQDGLQRM